MRSQRSFSHFIVQDAIIVSRDTDVISYKNTSSEAANDYEGIGCDISDTEECHVMNLVSFIH